MTIKSISEKFLLPDKRDIIKLHLYLKLIQYNIKPFENHMDIIIELYLFGGYSNPEEQEKFIQTCLSKKLRKSDQSLRNALSQYVELKVFSKPKNSSLYVNEKFLPKIESDKLVLEYTLSHAK